MTEPPGDRYGDRPKVSRTEQEWLELARTAIKALIGVEHAVTIAEMEARLSDRVWDNAICPDPIEPHLLTTARAEFRASGELVATSTVTKGAGGPVSTWSFPPARGLIGKIEDAAQRKRLLTARHNGWSRRGGAGRGLIGRAGEDALTEALRSPRSLLSRPTGSTTEVLGVNLSGLGEVDNSAFYIDDTDPADPQMITVVFEVKNTRSWYYADNAEVLWFLAKAARIQAERPGRLILPVFLCRRWHWTLWVQGEEAGFLPAEVRNQLVLPDAELTPERFEQVRLELGYEDLVLDNAATNRHLGIVSGAMAKYARPRAELWAQHHAEFLHATAP